MTKAWSDMSTREYKNLKGLTKENLRDNMTNFELVLNLLAKQTTKHISLGKNPKTFNESKEIAKHGGNVAKQARLSAEVASGIPIITNKNSNLINSENEEN